MQRIASRSAWMVAALVAATIAAPALAQSGRLSLAERVERLEQQATG